MTTLQRLKNTGHAMRFALRTTLPALLVLSVIACAGSNKDQLRACINNNQPYAEWTTWSGTLNGDRSKYKVQGVWWSAHPNSGSPLTLLTHLTLEQKWQLKALCSSWQGPLSAVIHLPTIKPAPSITLNLSTSADQSVDVNATSSAADGADAAAAGAAATANTEGMAVPTAAVSPVAVEAAAAGSPAAAATASPIASAAKKADAMAIAGQAASSPVLNTAARTSPHEQAQHAPAAAVTAALAGAAASSSSLAGIKQFLSSPVRDAATAAATRSLPSAAAAAIAAARSPAAAAQAEPSSTSPVSSPAAVTQAGPITAGQGQGTDPSSGGVTATRRALLSVQNLAAHRRHAAELRASGQARNVLQATGRTGAASDGAAGVAVGVTDVGDFGGAGGAPAAGAADVTHVAASGDALASRAIRTSDAVTAAAVDASDGTGTSGTTAMDAFAARADGGGDIGTSSPAVPSLSPRSVGSAHGKGKRGARHAPKHSAARNAKPAEGIAAQVEEARKHAQAIHASLERLNACQADIMLVQETYQEEPRDGDRVLSMYPGPAMQNYARLQARTPLVAYVDVDMIVSSNLFQEARQLNATALHSAGLQSQEGQGPPPKVAWVLPAFVVSGTRRKSEEREADRLAAAGAKQELLAALQRTELVTDGSGDEVLLARLDRLLASHLPTNYDRWLEVDAPYRVMYDEGYEPFVIVDRLSAAWSDQRFRGYLRGRPALTLALNAQGHHLVAHPRAYLIHRPHTSSSLLRRYAKEIEMEAFRLQIAAKRQEQWELHEGGVSTLSLSWYQRTMLSYDMALLTTVSGAAEQGLYRPVVDQSVLACIAQLPWWGKDAHTYNKARTYVMGKVWAVSDWDMEGGAKVDYHALHNHTSSIPEAKDGDGNGITVGDAEVKDAGPDHADGDGDGDGKTGMQGMVSPLAVLG